MVAARGQQRLQALGDVPPAQAEVTGWKALSRIVPQKSVEPGVGVSGLARGSPEADGEAFSVGHLIQGLCFLLACWMGASWDEGEVPGVWWERLIPSAAVSGSCGLSVLLSEEELGRQERHLPTSR